MSDAMIRKISHLREQAFQLLEAASELEMRPMEPVGGDVAMVFFEKVFGKAENKPYPYAAVRSGDMWYATSKRVTGGMTWNDLMDFVASGEDPLNLPHVYLATSLEAL